MKSLLAPLLLVLLVACGEDLPRPPVAPLTAAEPELQTLYKWGVGPHSVSGGQELNLAHPVRDETLRLLAWYPGSGEGDTSPPQGWPLLLFSHGNFSAPDKYDPLIEHWVSHGYAVLAPFHKDAGGSYLASTIDMVRYGNLGLIQARVQDLVALLDGLEEIEQQTGLRFNREQIAATGHSFGAFNAQQLGGAAAYNTDADSYERELDRRVRAVVAVSPPGPMFDEINDRSWLEQQTPTLMTTGTWDTNPMFWPDWRLHKMSFDTARAGDQFALVVQGADHYLGNLICRPELEEAPQHDALAMVNTAVIAFLDAYVMAEPAAMDFLRSGELDRVSARFAQLESR